MGTRMDESPPGVESLRGRIRRLPGATWVHARVHPHHLTTRLLRRAIRARARYARGRLLDVGCGGEPYRSLLEQVQHYVGVDVPPNPTADVAGSGLALPFRDEAFDTVLCTCVLEHVPEPGSLMAEIARTLRPSGHLLLTAPQTWQIHLAPNDFYRYTHYGLRYLAETSGLRVVEIAPTSGLWATVAQRIADTVVYTYAGRWARLPRLALWVPMALVLWSGAFLDTIFGLQGDTLDYVMVAQKSATGRGTAGPGG